MPKVSVVIPTYNYAHFLGETIRSVLDQTFTEFELIIVDDGSTDNTREVVAGFKDPRIIYIYQENRGVSAAQNNGINASTGGYIAILGSDDLWLPRNLELKVKVLDSRPEVALVCSDAYYFDNETGATLHRLWEGTPSHPGVDPRRASQRPLRELLAPGCFIMPQATLLRRRVFDEVGGFDESLRAGEDWDLFVRITRRFPVETIDIPLVRIRRHNCSLSGNYEKLYQLDVTVTSKAIRNYSLPKAELKLAKRRLAIAHFRYAHDRIINGKISLGRKKLLDSIKEDPSFFKPYIYLAASILGSRVFINVRAWRTRIKRQYAYQDS
jgi:glycosyltransferase involved in cell wall biosynthesis